MDNVRGFETLESDLAAEFTAHAVFDEDDAAIELPPSIAFDERRMQIRAYNFWTAQLHGKSYPSIQQLDPTAEADFRDYSVLVNFTSGIENPSVDFIGEKLQLEGGLGTHISSLDEVPCQSLLSRITDHYLQIIANRAPIGFEAEFVNDQKKTILYRGILLPYTSGDDTIDFLYGIINWKEVASDDLHATLQLEIQQSCPRSAGVCSRHPSRVNVPSTPAA